MALADEGTYYVVNPCRLIKLCPVSDNSPLRFGTARSCEFAASSIATDVALLVLYSVLKKVLAASLRHLHHLF